MAKLHVLLDIDDTLQKFVRDYTAKGGANQVKQAVEAGFEVKTWSRRGLSDVGADGKNGFCLRPGLREFMDFLFANYEVSLWTASEWEYADAFANVLTNGNPAKFKDILSDEDYGLSVGLNKGKDGKNLHYLFYDYNEKYIDENPRIVDTLAKRNRNIEETNEQREEDGKPIFSPNVKKLFTGYAPCNTVLIDDAAYNINDKNRQNFIRIQPFGGHTESKENKMSPLTLDKADSELAKIIEILKSLKLDCSDSEKLLLPPPPGDAWTTATWTQTAGRRTRKVRRRRLRNARSLKRK